MAFRLYLSSFIIIKKTSGTVSSDGGAGDVGVVVSTDIRVHNVADNNSRFRSSSTMWISRSIIGREGKLGFDL